MSVFRLNFVCYKALLEFLEKIIESVTYFVKTLFIFITNSVMEHHVEIFIISLSCPHEVHFASSGTCVFYTNLVSFGCAMYMYIFNSIALVCIVNNLQQIPLW